MSKLKSSIPAKPEVLRWARLFRGLSILEAASELSTTEDELSRIEGGNQPVTSDIFRRMKSVYRQTESALLLPRTPTDLDAPQDFRTVRGVTPTLSRDTRWAIRIARRMQREVSDLLDEVPELFPSADITAATISDDPEDAASVERAKFPVSLEAQRNAPLHMSSYRSWRAAVQERGILVLQQPMPWGDCRGFSLWDGEQVPVIVVNSSDTANGRIFTLFHEYAHLALRSAGTCIAGPGTDGESVEPWCNRFSAAFLVPKNELIGSIQRRHLVQPDDEWTVNQVRNLAREFRVSDLVMGIRLKETGVTALYERAKFDWYWKDQPKSRRVIHSGDNDLKREPAEQTLARSLGFGAIKVVLDSVREGVIDTGDAADILGLESSRLPDLDNLTSEHRQRDRFAA
ncbi:MAG: ImmA/IrrE family metallo-endopeptidase [Chloroflexi bacterium]|nr:ImmA/IrrE family metallo-endopeptidase [Chloroflexota bacterium]